MAAIGKKLGVVGPILDLSMIVVLFLMVWKPGGLVARTAHRAVR